MATTSLCRVLKADDIARPFRNEIKSTLSSNSNPSSELIPKEKSPKLVGLLATDSAPARSYADWTRKACEDVGISFELRDLTKENGSSQEAQRGNGNGGVDVIENGTAGEGVGGIEQAILDANSDEGIQGIMVYYPVFDSRQDQYLQQAVSPLKDVEGLHFSYLFNLYHNIRLIDPRSLSLAHFASPALLSSMPSSSSSNPLSPSTTSSKPIGKPETDGATGGAGGTGDVEEGRLKSILPCTPLAIVKALEYSGVYNSLLNYGSRAFGRVVTIINRSEVVGRPLAALLSNDGARVFSVDLDSILEFNRRTLPPPTSSNNNPSSDKKSTAASSSYHPHHIISKSSKSLKECLEISDVVISGVPSEGYKVKTEDLKDGLVAINFSSGKNFGTDIKQKASMYLPSIGKITIAMLQRNLLRLTEYQKQVAATSQSLSSS